MTVETKILNILAEDMFVWHIQMQHVLLIRKSINVGVLEDEGTVHLLRPYNLRVNYVFARIWRRNTLAP